MPARVPFAALAVVLVAAGCVGLPERELSEAASSPEPRAEPSAAVGARAPAWSPPGDPPLAKRAVDVTLEVVDPWVRPRQAFDAVAVAPADARLSWFVAAEGGDAFVVDIAGFLYVGGAPPEADAVPHAHAHAPPPHAPVATGAIPSGESTRGFAFPKEGRYVLETDASPGALVNVTANASEARRDVAHVTLLEDAHGVRFVPSELSIHPETLVRFWNAAPVAAQVREARFYASIPEVGEAPRFMAVDPGRYEMLVVARAGEAGWGEARAPLVIDFESPLARVDVGPFEGRVSSVPTPDAPASRAHAFEVAHPLRSLALNLSTDSRAPAPHAVELALLHEGVELFAAQGASFDAAMRDLPAGNYTIELRAAAGLLVSYHVRGEAHHRLHAPPSDPS